MIFFSDSKQQKGKLEKAKGLKRKEQQNYLGKKELDPTMS